MTIGAELLAPLLCAALFAVAMLWKEYLRWW